MSEEKQKKKLSDKALDKAAGGWQWGDLNPFKKKDDVQLDGYAWGDDDEIVDIETGEQHIDYGDPFNDNYKI